MHPINIESIISIAVRAVDLVLTMRRDGNLGITTKSNITDLVTEADLASEKLIRAALYDLNPSFGFMGEESKGSPSEEFYWVVDPIDGTVNFANEIPYGAVTIALQQGEQTLLGVTAQIPYRRIYWTKLGEGAYARDPDGSQRRLAVNSVDTLQMAFMATGFPYHLAEYNDNNHAEFAYIHPRCRGLRLLGAAAIDIANVATGGLAAFWEGWLHPWDAATGALLVREAGGTVTGYDGTPWRFGSAGLVASNGKIHGQLLDAIQTARQSVTEKLIPV